MNNHITTLSRERLEQLADENTICKVSWDERIEMSRALLAVMDARDNSTIRKRKALLWLERQQLANPCMKEVRYAIEIIATPPTPTAPDGWIKCSDSMPAVKDFLWVYDGVEPVRAYYYESGNIFIRDNGDELYRVTHWMPLPAAPEQ